MHLLLHPNQPLLFDKLSYMVSTLPNVFSPVIVTLPEDRLLVGVSEGGRLAQHHYLHQNHRRNL